MKYSPYPEQQAAIDYCIAWLRAAAPGDHLLLAGPTGSGKSIVEGAIHAEFPDCWIVTPRDEILDGIMDKMELTGDPLQHRLCTPVKLRNRLLTGEVRTPGKLLWDEGHHQEADVWQQIDLLTGNAPGIAFTATPYRGSPKSTRAFRERWGEPLWMVTYEEAAALGRISVPEFAMLPLVDDDIVEVRGGDFDVTSIDSATVDRLGDLSEHSRLWHSNGLWDRPTIYACSSTACCVRLKQELLSRGLPCEIVSATTKERKQIFDAVEHRILALIHINIVTEGVDLKLRRLVDLAPTLSPVKWVQQLGRITRPVPPGEPPPYYVCTNRNIMRHAYALEGLIPVSKVVEADNAFALSDRGHSARAFGLEAVGRFKPTTVKLLSGLTCHMYALSVLVNNLVVEYCCLIHPMRDEPLWASKVITRDSDTTNWGKWVACDPPTDLRGFGSKPQREPSEKQAAWWNRAAATRGLDPEQPLSRKNFPVLPVLFDLGERFT